MSIHTEPDYINRRELLGEISKHFETIGANAERLVSRFPKADVVEVVRCRNCQHIEKSDDEQKALFDTDAEYYCNHLDCPVDGNGFCSAGKRR